MLRPHLHYLLHPELAKRRIFGLLNRCKRNGFDFIVHFLHLTKRETTPRTPPRTRYHPDMNIVIE